MVFRKIYFGYVSLVFLLSCLVFVPTLLILSYRRSWHHTALSLHRVWSASFFALIGIRIQVIYKQPIDRSASYIFCANHFSYADIPVMCRLPFSFKFIGKSSLAKIPVFGSMFKRLHIAVDRESVKSRAKSMGQSRKALEEGFNLMFFPEGGIISTDPPNMVKFKDGAFRLSQEWNVPIVPVSLMDNYHILPDGSTDLRPGKCRVIVHSPIYPKDVEGGMEALKNRVWEVIDQELINDESEFVPAVR